MAKASDQLFELLRTSDEVDPAAFEDVFWRAAREVYYDLLREEVREPLSRTPSSGSPDEPTHDVEDVTVN